MPAGRPTKYNSEIAALVCERVATTTCGLKRMCDASDDLPDQSTVNLWRLKHPEFSDQYALAKLKQADLLAEECLEISDNVSEDTLINTDGFEVANAAAIARARLRIDTRKWLASKLLPKQYGDRNRDEKEAHVQSLVERLVDKLVEN